MDAVVVALESPLPASIPAGRATAIFLYGAAHAGQRPVDDLEIIVDGLPQRPRAQGMPRFDLPCRRSGFWEVVDLPSRDPGILVLDALVRIGDEVHVCRLGEITITAAALTPPFPAPAPTGAGPGTIAVCLATYEPDPELLRAQLESLRRQTDRDWVCVVSDDHSSEAGWRTVRDAIGDDPRFVFSRAERRLGFYRNFERAIASAPAGTELIALCDQDDIWHPDKLATLRDALGGAALVYSDQRLVDRRGRVMAPGMWTAGRHRGGQRLASLLVANWVTGAASLLRRDVAAAALPFPDSPGMEFHDHWIACAALTCGDLAYVDRPLYDYVQHGGAVLGKVSGEGGVRRGLWYPRRLPRMAEWRAAYFMGIVPVQIRARTLLGRAGPDLAPGKRRALLRLSSGGSSPLAFAWLVVRPIRGLWGHDETLAGEWDLARGALWFAVARLISRLRPWPDRWLLDTQLPHDGGFQQRRLRRWRAGLGTDDPSATDAHCPERVSSNPTGSPP